MRLPGVPDSDEYFVVRDPVDQILAGLGVALESSLNNDLVEFLDALDALLQELRLETLLDEFELEHILRLPSLLAGHQTLSNHARSLDCLIGGAMVQVSDFFIRRLD